MSAGRRVSRAPYLGFKADRVPAVKQGFEERGLVVLDRWGGGEEERMTVFEGAHRKRPIPLKWENIPPPGPSSMI